MAGTLSFVDSTTAYEDWLRAQLGSEFVARDIATKHAKMDAGPFPFLRATYWRWAERILDKGVCRELADAPAVLAVGDIHLENFGTWRDIDGRLIWGVNDFDEAAEMPYALDLVRLAASAILAAKVSPAEADKICARLLAGYRGGLAKPHAIVLDRTHAGLRQLAMIEEKARQQFWAKIDALPPGKQKPPARFMRVLAAAMPENTTALQFHTRVAGAGSLGRPRWAAIADWHGAPVIREAKALVPSAWTLVPGRGMPVIRAHEIATGRYRAPDPWYASTDNLVVRRLSPNNRKMDAEHELDVLLHRDVLTAMGHELANIHLADTGRRGAILRDLDRRGRNWLARAAAAAAVTVMDDHASWIARGKNKKGKAAK